MTSPPKKQTWQQFRALGCASLALCDVAAGGLDGYVDAGPWHAPWDYLGGYLACIEAGAVVRDFYGDDLVTDGTDSLLDDAAEEALARGELGVQVAVWGPDGLVSEASAGIADARTGRRVDSSTVFPVYSVTKAITATVIHPRMSKMPEMRNCPIVRSSRARTIIAISTGTATTPLMTAL